MGLIDAAKAMVSIDDIVCSMSVSINSDYCHGMIAMKDMALHAIEEQPTVDAVPVVRCKDCIYWDRGTIRMIAENPDLIGAICDKYHKNGISEDVWTAADHFCADGERRSNEQQG